MSASPLALKAHRRVRSRGLGLLACALTLLTCFSFARTARADFGPPIVQTTLRVGYVPGEGLSVGVGITSEFFRINANRTDHLVFVLGLSSGADMILRFSRTTIYRLNAGPQASFISLCPVVTQTIVSGGPILALARGSRAQMGWNLGAAFLTALTDRKPDYNHPAREPQFFTGAFYQFARFGADLNQHTVGADLRALFNPFDQFHHGLGSCGGN